MIWLKNDMKAETGVMIMKDGKAWGITHEDGHTTSYGWMDPQLAPIHDPKYCKKPTDAPCRTSQSYAKELEGAKVVPVRRVVTVEVLDGEIPKEEKIEPSASKPVSQWGKLSSFQIDMICHETHKELLRGRSPSKDLNDFFAYKADCIIETERRIALAEQGIWDFKKTSESTPPTKE